MPPTRTPQRAPETAPPSVGCGYLSMSLLELADDTMLLCIDFSLRSCVLLACTSKLVCAKLQHAAASQGLRLVAGDVQQAFQIKKRLRGAFHIGELVLTCKKWPFWPDWTLTVHLFGHFDKLHTVLVNSEHADEVTELYTLYNQDSNEFSQAKKELISMRSSGEFKIVARPIKTVRPMRQMKLTEMVKWVQLA